MGSGDKFYPTPSYTWRIYRQKLLSLAGDAKSKNGSELSRRLEQMRYSVFPKRFRSKMEWLRATRWIRKYYDVLEGAKSCLEVRAVQNMGVGVFARKKIKKGVLTGLFGYLHRVSHETAIKLDEAGETSLVQFRKQVLGRRKRPQLVGGKQQEKEGNDEQKQPIQKRRKRAERIEWYYLGGPASLLNHACNSFNVEYAFDERGDDGEFLVHVLRDVEAGQELLVHYGDEFWEYSNLKCLCQDCKPNKQKK